MKKNEEPYVGMPIYLDDCDWPIGMTYTPMQQWESTYDPEKALQAGTIFPSLDLWFMGGGTR